MVVERCPECGFDGASWTDAQALEACSELPQRWSHALRGLTPTDLHRRPIDHLWSIAEYTDHVRETAFGMRFVLDMIVEAPGTDLGDPPQPPFEPRPREVDAMRSLARFGSEIEALCSRLRGLPPEQWARTCTIAGDDVDVHWVARHIVHDVTHHLGDVARLRGALDPPLAR